MPNPTKKSDDHRPFARRTVRQIRLVDWLETAVGAMESWEEATRLVGQCDARTDPAEPGGADREHWLMCGAVGLAMVGCQSDMCHQIRVLLRHEDTILRRAGVLVALSVLRTRELTEAASVIEELGEMLYDADDHVRVSAAIVLFQLGDAANVALPRLIDGLSDRNSKVRQWSAHALGAIGPLAEPATEALLTLGMGDRDEQVAEAAMEAWMAIRL